MGHASAIAAIERALSTEQIGTAVAVRASVCAATHREELETLAGFLLDRSLNWLDEPAASLFACQAGEADHLTILAKTASGKTALVAAALRRGESSLVEVIVYGNRGLLSWEGDDGGCLIEPPLGSSLSNYGEQALSMLRASLEQNAPVNADGRCESRHPPTTASHLPATMTRRPTRLEPPYGLLLVSGDHTHQPGYADALLADGRCQLIGLTDEDEVSDARRQLNHRLAERLGIPVLPDLQQALQRDDVHIVSICAEPVRRGRIIVAAAKAGKHLYLDKPLAASVAEADAIVQAVHEANVVAHMFSQVHWDPARQARAWLDSGRLGELVAIHCDVCFAKGHGGSAKLGNPRRESARPERFELSDSKRELTNVGVYPVAMLLWLLDRDVESVYGATGNFFFAEHQANDMEDFGQVMLQFSGGVTATVSAGRAGWRSHPGFGVHRVCLIGSQATVTLDAHRPRLEVWADVPPWTAPPRDPEDPMGMWAAPPDSLYKARPKDSWVSPSASPWTMDAQHFLDCVGQGRDSEISAGLAAKSTEILLAAYQSASSGGVVELPLPRP